jgi:broad specificity phosphatase PhoE
VSAATTEASARYRAASPPPAEPTASPLANLSHVEEKELREEDELRSLDFGLARILKWKVPY